MTLLKQSQMQCIEALEWSPSQYLIDLRDGLRGITALHKPSRPQEHAHIGGLFLRNGASLLNIPGRYWTNNLRGTH